MLSFSDAKLAFRAEGDVAPTSIRGDSKAFGIAGTGGTSSSAGRLNASNLGFGVGSREVENVCDSLGCKEPLELRIEL